MVVVGVVTVVPFAPGVISIRCGMKAGLDGRVAGRNTTSRPRE